ncbi:MAG: saccharopine dehydrogenase NADP-binding domain-containing protein [Pseudomonadales bacterium]|nr:saccharopine dehydrogenase NADP-binding domain-containing protein [Pseudomonadales bacterium]
MKRVVVVGGYGPLGTRLCHHLSQQAGLDLVVAGASQAATTALASRLSPQARAQLSTSLLAPEQSDFSSRLQALAPDLVIDADGPFRSGRLRVAEACLRVGAHYLDTATERRHVCNLAQLNQSAQQAGVLLVSGATAAPGLTSAVVSHYRDDFATLASVDLALAPGRQVGIRYPLATRLPCRWDFGGAVGHHWTIAADAADQVLLPGACEVSERVQLQVAVPRNWRRLPAMAMARLRSLAAPCQKLPAVPAPAPSLATQSGADPAALQVVMTGTDRRNRRQTLCWQLTMATGDNIDLAILPALLLARRWLQRGHWPSGAGPCVARLSLAEIQAQADDLGFQVQLWGDQPPTWDEEGTPAPARGGMPG